MLLEQKIQEYESKLKKISQEPETQEIWALAKKTALHGDSESTENIFQETSEVTLGESQKFNDK